MISSRIVIKHLKGMGNFAQRSWRDSDEFITEEMVFTWDADVS